MCRYKLRFSALRSVISVNRIFGQIFKHFLCKCCLEAQSKSRRLHLIRSYVHSRLILDHVSPRKLPINLDYPPPSPPRDFKKSLIMGDSNCLPCFSVSRRSIIFWSHCSETVTSICYEQRQLVIIQSASNSTG